MNRACSSAGSAAAVFLLTAGLLASCQPATQPAAVPEPSATTAAPASQQPTAAAATETPGESPDAQPSEGEALMALTLTSSEFPAGGPIPTQFTCDGEDLSPPLSWSDPPAGTSSFALIVDDPDAPAGTWIHWVLFNLPGSARSLPGSIPPQAELQDGSQQGTNDFRRLGYGGPCPPGGTHRYFFRLFALDQALELAAGASEQDLRAAMQGHILQEAELMGTYSR